MIKSKFKAAGIHFCFSGIIFLILAYFIIFKWYPFPYFTADGGWQGIRIVALIDLILGPFLTLIIFNPYKSRKEIHFDLGLIVLIQISVLMWGIYTVYNERPVAMVHWDGEFHTIPSKSFKKLNISDDQLNYFGEERPVLIHAHHPTDQNKIREILIINTKQNLAPFEQIHLYRPFKENKADAFTYKIDINEIISHNAKMKEELDMFLSKSRTNKEDYIYMPLNARYHNVVLIFSKEGDVVSTLNAPYK